MKSIRRLRVVTFDLDGTIWDPEMYQLPGGSPFHQTPDGLVRDSRGIAVRLLGDFPRLLLDISADPSDIKLAIASSTDEPEWARECLEKIVVSGKPLASYFHSTQIYKGNKAKHLTRIAEELGVHPTEIVFFDNEHYNITNTTKIGVHAVYVPNPITFGDWLKAKALFGEGEGR